MPGTLFRVSTATPTRADELRRLHDEAQHRGWAKTARETGRVFSENELVVYATSIAFRVLFALVPLALFAVALLGFLQLEEVWRDSLAPEVRERTSSAAFTLIDRTAVRVLTSREGFWLTAGAVLALWEVSGAIRVCMRALDRIYCEARPRPVKERLGVSLALSVPVGGCILGAVACVQVVPPLLDRGSRSFVGSVGGAIVGWGLAALLVALTVAVLVRYGSSSRQPFRLAGVASIFVVVSWAITSALFGVYATRIASYGSVFGGLAFAIILMTYVYLSAVTFLAGLQVDALLRGLPREREAPAPHSTS